MADRQTPISRPSHRLLAAVLRLLAPPLAILVARWIARQREHHGARGHPLSDDQRTALLPYFRAHTLDAVRVRQVDQVRNPWFTRPLVALGADLDLRRAAGIALGTTVLITRATVQRMTEAELQTLLCHELVHVVQYRVLGVKNFLRTYVSGWLDHGMVYEKIPLELQAFSIEERFRQGILGQAEDEIRKSLAP